MALQTMYLYKFKLKSFDLNELSDYNEKNQKNFIKGLKTLLKQYITNVISITLILVPYICNHATKRKFLYQKPPSLGQIVQNTKNQYKHIG